MPSLPPEAIIGADASQSYHWCRHQLKLSSMPMSTKVTIDTAARQPQSYHRHLRPPELSSMPTPVRAILSRMPCCYSATLVMLLLHHAGHAANPPCRPYLALLAMMPLRLGLLAMLLLGHTGHAANPPYQPCCYRPHTCCYSASLAMLPTRLINHTVIGLTHAATRPRWPCCNSASLKMLLIGLAGHTVTPPHWPCCYSATPAMLLLVLAGHATTANIHSEAGQHLLPPSLVFSIQTDSRSIGGVIRGSTSFGYIYLWSGGGWEPALQRGHSH